MKKHFYSHLIDTSVFSLELGNMDLNPSQRLELIALVESNLHQVILDAVLSELSEEDKKIFLKYLHVNDQEKIWQHLRTKVQNIEEKIKKAAEDLKKEMHNDIKDAKLLPHKK